MTKTHLVLPKLVATLRLVRRMYSPLSPTVSRSSEPLHVLTTTWRPNFLSSEQTRDGRHLLDVLPGNVSINQQLYYFKKTYECSSIRQKVYVNVECCFVIRIVLYWLFIRISVHLSSSITFPISYSSIIWQDYKKEGIERCLNLSLVKLP